MSSGAMCAWKVNLGGVCLAILGVSISLQRHIGWSCETRFGNRLGVEMIFYTWNLQLRQRVEVEENQSIDVPYSAQYVSLIVSFMFPIAN